MSYKVNMPECIDCRLCIPECPDGGLTVDENGIYKINKDSCTECIEVGFSQCLNICPVDCIELDLENKETNEELYIKVEKNKKIALDKLN